MTEYALGSPSARALLAEALRADPPRLDWVAVAIARLEYADLPPAPIEEALEQLAARVRATREESSGGLAPLQALQRVLGAEEGYRGNEVQYHAPENSFLNIVLEKKVGLPISLSVLYLEVARRARIPLYGVSFPGHFVVACDTEGGKLVMDPFNGGQILTTTGCEDLLAKVAPQVKFTDQMIAPTAVKTIAFRMLNNLKRVYLDQGDGERALRVVDLMLLVSPDHPGELRARAAILSALGAYRAALADIERCLEISPEAPDHQTLVMTAKALRQRVDQLN
ncbi:MAG: SirB1 family protein [Myxococcaceae bacterium]